MRDFNELNKAFEKGLSVWQKDILKKEVNKIGQKALAEIKALTPVDTGLLRRRWRAKVKGSAEDMLIEISNNTEYTAAVNYGRRKVKGGKTTGKTKGAYMLEKGLNNYRVKGLRRDIDKMLEELKKRL